LRDERRQRGRAQKQRVEVKPQPGVIPGLVAKMALAGIEQGEQCLIHHLLLSGARR
jgi:hypothetical protein